MISLRQSEGSPRKRRRHRTPIAALALVSAFGLIAAACGSDNNNSSSDTTAASGSSDTTAASGSSDTTAAPATGSEIKIGLHAAVTGPIAVTFGSAEAGAKAAVKEINDAGGVNGHPLSLTVYDSQSTIAGGDAAVRRALNDKVFAILANDVFIDSSIPLLVEQKVPVVGFGTTPNWYGPDKTNMFSYTGDILNQTEDSLASLPLAQGLKKMGVVAKAETGSVAGAKTWAKMIPAVGGELTYEQYAFDVSDIAGVNAIAQQIIDSGTQVILSTMPTGSAELQAAINQLGGKVLVIEPAQYGPAIEEQFGKSVDGMIAAQWYATLEHTEQPGVTKFLKAMEASGAKNPRDPWGVYGYISVMMFADGLKAVQGDPTPEKFIAAMNDNHSVDNIGGLIQTGVFPEAHDHIVGAWSYSIMKDGKWAAYGGKAFPGNSKCQPEPCKQGATH